MKTRAVLFALGCAVLLPAGCSLPPVALSTPQPLKVNIDMKLDVYQHGPAQKTPVVPVESTTPEAIQDRRRLRLGEIQPLKNSRLVGENHLGLLEVRNQTPGEYGDYVQGIVTAENKDRMSLMESMAKTQNVPLTQIEKQQSDNAQHSAFNGEWIEVQKPDGTWSWAQKGND